MSAPVSDTARELKRLLIEVAPLVEEHTRRVCPGCADVCCRQRHGMFTAADRAYLELLGENDAVHEPGRAPDGPCQFLGPHGCSRPRWQRAWKCTWYFCDPLLAALNEGPQRSARRLSALLDRLGGLYGELERNCSR